MSEEATTRDDPVVPDDLVVPGKLPRMRLRELPEPVPLRKMVGPSIVLAGLALGSGEFILWPYITFETRFVFFWACVLGVATQYFLNMEITRWSLATGESATTGFARLSRHFAWIFLILNIVPWIVPAWSKGAAQVLTWLFWPPEDGSAPVETAAVTWFSVGGLVLCGVILTAGKVVYETVERVQLILVSLVLALVVVLAFLVVRPDAITAQVVGAVSFGQLPELTDQLTVAFLLGAVAFAGVGGTLNLGQSNYVKDKGYGMGNYIGRITSPVTGQEEAISEIGFHFPHDEANRDRWKRWWRAASAEHFLSFFVTCLVTLVLLTLICYSIFYDAAGERVADHSEYGHDLGFIWGESVVIRDHFGNVMKVLFLIMGFVILLTTEFGVLDASSRVSADIVKVNWLAKNEIWTESRLYFAFLWGTIAVGCVILVAGYKTVSSLQLFKFTAAMNGGVMFVYSVTLLLMNRFRLRGVVRMSAWRAGVMVFAILFFGSFSFWLLFRGLGILS